MSLLLSQNNHLLLLGGSLYYKHTYQTLSKKGFKLTCIDSNPQAYCRSLADNFIHADYSDIDLAYEKIKPLNIDCILPLNDVGVITAASIAELMPIKSPSLSVAKSATYKPLMKKAWVKNNLPTANYFVAENYNEVIEGVRVIGLPCILKPANGLGGGSRGVVVVNKFQEIDNAMNFTMSFADDSKVLIEEFMDYQSEHSIECLVSDEIAEVILIGDNHKIELPFRVNKKITYPTNLSKNKQSKLIELCKRSIDALGISFGAVHVEAGFKKGDPYLIELGLRAGGGAIFHPITKIVTGYDYVSEAVKVLLGINAAKYDFRLKKKVEYQFITNQYDDRSLNLFKKNIKRNSKVYDYHIEQSYDPEKKIKTGLDRQGYVIFVENL